MADKLNNPQIPQMNADLVPHVVRDFSLAAELKLSTTIARLNSTSLFSLCVLCVLCGYSAISEEKL